MNKLRLLSVAYFLSVVASDSSSSDSGSGTAGTTSTSSRSGSLSSILSQLGNDMDDTQNTPSPITVYLPPARTQSTSSSSTSQNEPPCSLCECWDISLEGTEIDGDSTCYSYKVRPTYGNIQCRGLMFESLLLSNSECSLDSIESITHFTPSTLSLTAVETGLSVDILEGRSPRRLTYDRSNIYGFGNRGSSESQDQTVAETASDQPSSGDTVEFTMCFASDSVDGLVEEAEITYNLEDSSSSTCKMNNIFPNFCNAPSVSPTLSPTLSVSCNETIERALMSGQSDLIMLDLPEDVVSVRFETCAPLTDFDTIVSALDAECVPLTGDDDGCENSIGGSRLIISDDTTLQEMSAISVRGKGISGCYSLAVICQYAESPDDGAGDDLPADDSPVSPPSPPPVSPPASNPTTEIPTSPPSAMPTTSTTTTTPQPTTASPTADPSSMATPTPTLAILRCGDSVNGVFTPSFDGVFEIVIPFDGLMAFDASSSNGLTFTSITIRNAVGTVLGQSTATDGLATELPAGTYFITMDATPSTTSSTFSVVTACASDSPTASPTSLSPTKSPSASPSTAQPSQAPTYTVCDSDDAFNVAFLLDESGSINETDWNLVKNFVGRIVEFDVSPISYVSLFEYASLPAYEQFLDWTSNGAQQTILDALQDNVYNLGGQTYTYDAVSRVLDNFWNYRSSCSDGCDTRHDILFVLTDGAPTDTVCPQILDRVTASSIDIVVIVIGDGSFMNEIECLDANDNQADIHFIPEFGSDEFNALEVQIRAKICSGSGTATPSIRPDPDSEWVYEDGETAAGPVPTRSGNGGQQGAADRQAFGAADDVDDDEEWENAEDDQADNTVTVVVAAFAALLAVIAVMAIYIIHNKRKTRQMLSSSVQSIDLAEMSGDTQDAEVTVTEPGVDGVGNEPGNEQIDGDGAQLVTRL